MSAGEVRAFLEDNHIQGFARSSVKYGLTFQGELVYVTTFGKPRFSDDSEYELIRMASKRDIKVYGAASKLFKHFIKEKSPKKVISYSNIDKFGSAVYDRIGFEYVGSSEPNYVYYKQNGIITRYAAQKHKLKNVIENFDPDKSEFENMIDNGYRIYHDCGNRKFIWEK